MNKITKLSHKIKKFRVKIGKVNKNMFKFAFQALGAVIGVVVLFFIIMLIIVAFK